MYMVASSEVATCGVLVANCVVLAEEVGVFRIPSWCWGCGTVVCALYAG